MPRAQIKDIAATLAHGVDYGRVSATARHAEAGFDTVDALLAEAGRMARQVWGPLNQGADRAGARLVEGRVATAPGFVEAYRGFAEAGWVGVAADPEHGGQGLPFTLQCAVNELFASQCLSLSLCPLLSQGAIEALSTHGSAEQRARYLPGLVSGLWTGTMNLTEPQAGTDLGALRTRAEPDGAGGYRLTGQKIWISWGDTDFADNIVHLVLARLPDAPAGVRGVSLFVCPKFLADGARNAVGPIALEEKMGLHGSPTCVMAFDGARAELVGAPNAGVAAMFTMMNNARLGVGIEGVASAQAALRRALAFAIERRQGRTPVGDGTGPVFDHADVRRMVATMKAETAAARAICLDCAVALDLARAAETEAARAEAAATAAFLTPIAKAYGTDVGCEVASLGIQVHGGAGYVEATGAAQIYRDVRVTAIYEGTNGVQAMDLVGRKLSVDEGATARRLLARAQAEAAALTEAGPALAPVGAALSEAATAALGATQALLGMSALDRAAGGAAYLRLLARVLGAEALGRIARRSGEPARAALARFHAGRLLPETAALARAAVSGSADLYALDADGLVA